MELHDSILRHMLRHSYFITGTAYAGKSTMVRLLSKRYGLVECGENYHSALSDVIARPDTHPAISYFDTMSGWEEFLTRTPEEYDAWVQAVSREAAQFEVAHLLSLNGKPAIVDTNISLDLLHRIADPSHVAVMLSPQSMSVEKFFQREDPEKQFLLDQLRRLPDPQAALANFQACIARINSPERYAAFAESGFFTIVREDDARDTREEVLHQLAEHFGLEGSDHP